MEWYYVWWPWLTSKRVARGCQHQLSFLFLRRIGWMKWLTKIGWFFRRVNWKVKMGAVFETCCSFQLVPVTEKYLCFETIVWTWQKTNQGKQQQLQLEHRPTAPTLKYSAVFPPAHSERLKKSICGDIDMKRWFNEQYISISLCLLPTDCAASLVCRCSRFVAMQPGLPVFTHWRVLCPPTSPLRICNATSYFLW